MAGLLTLRDFARNLLKGNRFRNIIFFHISDPADPTHYLLDYGDFPFFNVQFLLTPTVYMLSRICIEYNKIPFKEPHSNDIEILAPGCSLGTLHNAVCRSCNAEKEDETTEQLLCYRSALGNLRSRFFRHPEFSDKICLTKGDLRKIHIRYLQGATFVWRNPISCCLVASLT